MPGRSDLHPVSTPEAGARGGFPQKAWAERGQGDPPGGQARHLIRTKESDAEDVEQKQGRSSRAEGSNNLAGTLQAQHLDGFSSPGAMPPGINPRRHLP